ncbi:hypothetical protein [Pontimicrobium aquaticum]|uniref:Uncharacterized protein n=1 Tax=Pontimicrobium aquaticum TaxID=2565367 RepID=A0A4U0F4U2_9FLAO|nr:hypothetical protein [Pontimicrobium aquaticum]TJY37822.1 hypothetical protein E5167_00780 [Pontimicrobium aquaticum]
MKKIICTFSLLVAILVTVAAANKTENSSLTENFITGNPNIKSIYRLSFGPEGILFIGDSDSATIFALDTKDNIAKNKPENIALDSFDEKIASALGTTVKNINITDMSVNPISKNVYFSIQTKNGTPVLLRLTNGKLENVSLNNVSYAKTTLTNPISKSPKTKGYYAHRRWAISDMKYYNGKVFVSGLSNKEFSSSFSSIPFPFNNKQDFSTLEIYHAAHGRYETNAPIETFDITTIKGKEFILASYTCTPLVLFPIDKLENGKHIKGRTVSELGSGNAPIDIISFKKGKELKFFLSNTDTPVKRINLSDIIDFKGSMTKPVVTRELGRKVGGVKAVNLPYVNVEQMDKYDDNNALLLIRSEGHLSLQNRSL